MLSGDDLLLVADNITIADDELIRVQKVVNTAMDAKRDKSIMAKWNKHQQAKDMGKNDGLLSRKEYDAIEPVIRGYNEEIVEMFDAEQDKESKVVLRPISEEVFKQLVMANPAYRVDLAKQMRVLCNIQQSE